MLLSGEQGTGKSTAARMLVGLIDPSPAPLWSPPANERQWSITASAAWCIALDNVSKIPPWLSDALCKAVTGDGWVDRALYSDADISVLCFRRAIMLTSIDPGSIRGDLADRLLAAELEPIPDEERKTEGEIVQQYEDAKPQLLGALLQLLADVLEALPDVSLDGYPRMADFALMLAAMDRTVRTAALDTFLSGHEEIVLDVIDSDPVALAIVDLVSQVESWAGTMAELLDKITPESPSKEWPRTAAVLGGRIKRSRPALRRRGIEVTQERESTRERRRICTIRKFEKTTVQAVHTVHTPHPGAQDADLFGQSLDGVGVADAACRPITPLDGSDSVGRAPDSSCPTDADTSDVGQAAEEGVADDPVADDEVAEWTL